MMKLSRNVSYRETNISGNFHQAVLRFDLQIRKKYNIWSCVLSYIYIECSVQYSNHFAVLLVILIRLHVG